jgi:hypothetical protein
VTEISAEQAYRALQGRAREERRGTQELLIFYAHEGFLRRLSMSRHRENLVLKGGMLLAVLGARRPTRDADLSVQGCPMTKPRSGRSSARSLRSLPTTA